jgi:predicted nucleic acid-binding protein
MAEKKVVCDTDVMIDYFDLKSSRHVITKKITEDRIGLDNVMLSAITKLELINGATNKSELQIISRKLDRFNIILLDVSITNISFSPLETCKLSHGLTLPDCIIAATVLATDLDFFTYNTKDFKFIAKLRIFKQ